MDAEGFSDLLNAKRTGADKWMARCPSHSDRNASLSIKRGERGILLKCWSAGCTPAQICAALKLPVSALFDDDTRQTPEQLEDAASQRKIVATLERGKRLRDRERRHEVYRLERLRDSLGAKLTRFPNDVEIGRLFHETCSRIAETEPAIYPQHFDGPIRAPAPGMVPDWMAEVLSEISRTFNQKENHAAVQAA